MRRLGIGATATLVGAGLLSHQGCQSLQVAHEIGNARYELRGKHQLLVCEQCHGPLGSGCLGSGKPEAQPTSCMACHAEDVAPGHYPGQECFPCHTEAGWDVFPPTPTEPEPEPDTAPTGDTGTTPPEPEPDLYHAGVTEDMLCTAACHGHDEQHTHEDDRPADHWVDIPRQNLDWDCAGCHLTEDWTKFTPYVDQDHPVRLPHGTWNNQQPIGDPSAWVVACSACHIGTSPPTKNMQCMDACHDEIRFAPDEDHQGFLTGDPQLGCIECHDYADYWGNVP